MEKQAVEIDPTLRFRYEFQTPTILNTASAKRCLKVLVARTTLAQAESYTLAEVQIARWYCAEQHPDANLDVVLTVPANATVTIAVFDRYGVDYEG